MTGLLGPDGQPARPPAGPARIEGALPGLSLADAALFLPCSKALDHPDGPAAATELLLITVDGRDWTAKPRCIRHPAAADVRLITKAVPAALCLVVALFWPEQGDANYGAQPPSEPAADGPDVELRLGGQRPGLYVGGERVETPKGR